MSRTTVDRAELRARLAEWLQTIPQDGAPGIMLSVVVLHHRGSKIPVGRYRIEHGTTKASELADRIATAAQSDVRHKVNAGQQTYEVHAFFGDEGYPREQHRFPLEHVDDEEDGGADCAAPGVLRVFERGMRDAQNFGKGLAKSAAKERGETLSSALALVEILTNQLAAALKENGEQRAKLNDAEDRKQERLNSELRAKAWADAIKEGAQMVKVMIPIIVNRIRGEKIFPEVAHPLLEQFRLLYAELGEQEIAGILMATATKPRAQMLLGELMTLVEDERLTAIAKAKVVQEKLAEGSGQNPPQVTAHTATHTGAAA